jgi:hypothetical protein
MGIRFVKILPEMYKCGVKGLCEMSILCLSASFGESGLRMSNNDLARLMNSSRSGIIHAINNLVKANLVTIEKISYGCRVIHANGDSIRLYEDDKKKKQNSATVAPDSDTSTPSGNGDTIGQDGDTSAQNGLKVSKNGVEVRPITKVTKRTDSNIHTPTSSEEPFKLSSEPISKARKLKTLPIPTVDEVIEYINNHPEYGDVEPEAFWNHYEARGWKYGKGIDMKNWKAAVRTWHFNGRKQHVK